jgi:hypothetical protein
VLALCVMVMRGHAPLEALDLMKNRRGQVSPSPVQFECWTGWLERHASEHDVDWMTPSFEQFKAIAYRHLMTSS